jgi:sphingolipid C9-methyltransferase
MASKADLAGDINFIKTPAAKPSAFDVEDCGVPTTDVS